jgi:hypothetical protein
MMELIYNKEWVFLPLSDMIFKIVGHLMILAVMVGFNRLSYAVMDIYFTYTTKEYGQLEKYQKLYVVKNLTKSFILFLIVMLSLPWMVDIILYDTWNNTIMHFIGTLYVSTDLSGLLFVPNLVTRTKIHHIIVCLIGFCNLFTNYNEIGLHRALLTLTYMSAIPYMVNAYLGLRHLNQDEMKRTIVDVTLYIYGLSVVVNFLIQHLYIFVWISGFSLIKVIYLLKYYLILYDDLKLVQYLFYKYKTKYAFN